MYFSKNDVNVKTVCLHAGKKTNTLTYQGQINEVVSAFQYLYSYVTDVILKESHHKQYKVMCVQ